MDLDDILHIEDPRYRASAATAAIGNAEREIVHARRIRDKAIRELALSGMSKPKIAQAVGLSLSTVKGVLR